MAVPRKDKFVDSVAILGDLGALGGRLGITKKVGNDSRHYAFSVRGGNDLENVCYSITCVIPCS